jgi:hypothetical protein
MKKYKVTLSSGAYEEFIEENTALDFQHNNEGSRLDIIDIVDIQPDIEDLIVGYYQAGNWQLLLDNIEKTGVSNELLKHSNTQISSTAWTMYQVILGLMDWPIKQRTLTAEYRTFCYLIHTLSYALTPPRLVGLLDSLKECNLNVIHIDHLINSLKTTGLLDKNYTY